MEADELLAALTRPSPASGESSSVAEHGHASPLLSSWPAFVPAIHVFDDAKQDVDSRDEPAHDDIGVFDPERRLVPSAEKLSPDSPALAGEGRVGDRAASSDLAGAAASCCRIPHLDPPPQAGEEEGRARRACKNLTAPDRPAFPSPPRADRRCAARACRRSSARTGRAA